MIKINIAKAKEIAHEHRRNARAEEFKPLDLQVTIPMYAQEAELKRQAIREQYDKMQVSIDKAKTPEQIKKAIADLL